MDDSLRSAHGRIRPIDICLLGPLSVTIAGRQVEVRSPRARKLLALLATQHNCFVSFDSIIDVLWHEPPETARQQVYTVISILRRILGNAGGVAGIEALSDGYRLDIPSDAVDVARFQSQVKAAFQAEAAGSRALAADLLGHALQEWRGPLNDLTGSCLDALAASLSEVRLEAVERLAALLVGLGESARIVGPLFALVSEFPFRETLRAALMQALQVNGRQTEALASFEEGRLLLARELGLDPGPVLRNAHREVLKGIDAERVPAISYLPRDITEICGRDAEIEKLLDGVRDSRGRALGVVEICGMGGVGKTTLAVHVAHRLANRFPDGRYFLDLQGFTADRDPLEPAQALVRLLRQSGVAPEQIPSDVEERTALWRSRTADKRILVLLDNAADEAQVRPLLPGSARSFVLITSRRRMPALQGSIPLPLGIMAEDEAVALFRTIVGWERTETDLASVAKAVQLCGQLPLALQIAAARVRDRPIWTMRQLVRQLADDGLRARFLVVGDRDVMEVLSRSCRQLNADQRRLFRLLGTHSGPDFDAAAVAAMADCPLDEAEDTLEELLNANLLEQSLFGRYNFHDLVRSCARQLTERHVSVAEQHEPGRRPRDLRPLASVNPNDRLADKSSRVTAMGARRPTALHVVSAGTVA